MRRNTPEEARKLRAVMEAAWKVAEREGLTGVAVLVVLDDNPEAPFLTGAVAARTPGAIVNLALYGPEQLAGTMERALESAGAKATMRVPGKEPKA